jgi:RNA polymerase sigma-70 factor (ECF subfamily)
MDRSELSAAVDEALKRLPAEQREVFVMRQENMSFKEIAAIHDCSINTALARMQYAVKNLRKELGQWDIGGK